MARMRKFFKTALSVAGASLAACSGLGNQPSFSPSSAPAALRPLASKYNVTPHPDRSRSWMDARAKKGALLYLSDASTYDVYVYSWPSLALVGTLTGFNGPSGECVDAKGNVWIANTYDSELIEYAHGGTSPVATLSDSGQYPYSCAVNKKSGTLAAGNIESTSGSAGSVTIYKRESGSGTNFPDSNVYVNFVGYDRRGNLFVNGGSGSGYFSLQTLRKGTFAPVTLSGGAIDIAGGVQYADKSLSVGDQLGESGNPVIYQMSEKGRITGSTRLDSGGCSQYAIAAGMVVCPDAKNRTIDVYSYPSGGTATQTLSGSFSDPFAAAISQ